MSELHPYLREGDDQVTSLGNVITLMAMAQVHLLNNVEFVDEGSRAIFDILPIEAGSHAAFRATVGETGILRMYGYPQSEKPTGYSLLEFLFRAGTSKNRRHTRPETVVDKVASTGDLQQDAHAIWLLLDGLVRQNEADCAVTVDEPTGLVRVRFGENIALRTASTFGLSSAVLGLAFQPIVEHAGVASDSNHGAIFFDIEA